MGVREEVKTHKQISFKFSYFLHTYKYLCIFFFVIIFSLEKSAFSACTEMPANDVELADFSNTNSGKPPGSREDARAQGRVWRDTFGTTLSPSCC